MKSDIDFVQDHTGRKTFVGDVVVLGRRQGNYSMTKVGVVKYFKKSTNYGNSHTMRVQWMPEFCTGYSTPDSSSIQVDENKNNDFFHLPHLAALAVAKAEEDNG